MGSFVTADGRKLAYRRVGQGPVLVCHPGGPGFSSRYFGELAWLGASRTLVLLDPRGTAGSERPEDPRAYSIADYVADVEALRQHLGLERIDLLGHSHGGVVAMAYAITHPDRVTRLVLASTLARFAEPQADAMDALMVAKAGEPWYADARAALEAEQAGRFRDDEELAELVVRELPFYFASYGEAERSWVERLREERPNGDALRLFNDEIFTTFDLRGQLMRIVAPTLVVAGELDLITGPVCAREIAAGIQGARLVLLPEVGHFVFVEAPERFTGELLAFLDQG